MKIKISVTLPEELLVAIDGVGEKRSAFLERAARALLAAMERAAVDARDLDVYERNAKRLNREAADVLGFQQRGGRTTCKRRVRG